MKTTTTTTTKKTKTLQNEIIARRKNKKKRRKMKKLERCSLLNLFNILTRTHITVEQFFLNFFTKLLYRLPHRAL